MSPDAHSRPAAEVDGQQQEFILQALRGGVLEVRIRHPSRGIRAGGQTAALARCCPATQICRLSPSQISPNWVIADKTCIFVQNKN